MSGAAGGLNEIFAHGLSPLRETDGRNDETDSVTRAAGCSKPEFNGDDG
jgi:hypothetical protein